MKKKRTFKPVLYNAGDIVWYRSAMRREFRAMHKEVRGEIKRIVRENPLATGGGVDVEMAQDANPVRLVKEALGILARKWIDAFSSIGPSLSKELAERGVASADMQLERDAKADGLTVRYQWTDAMLQKREAIIEENVSLIRSIPEKYLTEVEGMVYRAMARGGDEAKLIKELTAGFAHREGVTERRIKFIAKDQVRKATAQLSLVRQRSAGIRFGIWKHGAVNKNSRHEHVKASNEQREFDLDKGCLIDGRYVFPGEEPGCSCTWIPVIPW